MTEFELEKKIIDEDTSYIADLVFESKKTDDAIDSLKAELKLYKLDYLKIAKDKLIKKGDSKGANIIQEVISDINERLALIMDDMDDDSSKLLDSLSIDDKKNLLINITDTSYMMTLYKAIESSIQNDRIKEAKENGYDNPDLYDLFQTKQKLNEIKRFKNSEKDKTLILLLEKEIRNLESKIKKKN